jgi:hypothetical protein
MKHLNSDSKSLLEIYNLFLNWVERLGYDEAIRFMGKAYRNDWNKHWEDVMLTYDYEVHSLKRGID